jgi:hypothetical protein
MLRLFVAAFTASVLSAAPDTVQILEGPPPEDVSAQIRPALSNRLYKVELKGNSTAEFWFRDEMPVREGSQGDLGVNFGLFGRGALLGVVRFSAPWKDYKDSSVKAGTYALRYAAQPADGDHTGVSLYRDFLLLVPADLDQEVDGHYTEQELVVMSKGASGSTHPLVMGMFPVWEEPETESVVSNELDQSTLVVKATGVTFGLVLIGHGEH